MYKGYEYRIYPTKEQKKLLLKTFGCCRYVYNKALEARIEHYQQTGKDLKSFELSKRLTKIKQTLTWLKEVDSQALQHELRHLDNAYTNFFRKKHKFPKFKSKKNSYQYYTTTYASRIYLDYEQNKIKLSKIGKIKIKIHKKPEGRLLYCTVKHTPTDKYFVSLIYENNVTLPIKPKITEETSIGIDLGLKNFAILSNGNKIQNVKFYKQTEDKIKKLKKRLKKKLANSQNRAKLNKKIAKIFEKTHNRRKDFLHKLTFKLTHDNQVDTYCIEKLAVQNLIKNNNLKECIKDVSWSTFVRYLKYKCDLYGKNLLQIGQFEPSSKMCTCGHINKELTLADREWTCPVCHKHHDRDILAANNIKKFALNKQNLIKTGLAKSEEPLEILQIDELGKF